MDIVWLVAVVLFFGVCSLVVGLLDRLRSEESP
jgi:hypothetical protein